jgi:hypothetical protein
MQNLISRIEAHINSLTSEEITKLIKANYSEEEAQIIDGGFFHNKEVVIALITFGYSEYMEHQNDKAKNMLTEIKELQLKNELHKKVTDGYKLLSASKFNKTDEIITILKSMGIREMYLTHFIDLNNLEDILLEIIKSGCTFDLKMAVLLLDIAYDFRIATELRETYVDYEKVLYYDKRIDVSKTEIELKNMIRRWKYNAEFNKKPKIKFEEKMYTIFKQYNFNMEQIKTSIGLELEEALYDYLNNRNNRNLKNLFSLFFKPILKKHGKRYIEKTFKPYFYIAFENTFEGLLTEEGFENENENNNEFTGKYSNNYEKYYKLKVKALTGI